MNDNYRLNISGDSSDLEKNLKIIQAYMDAIEASDIDKPLDGMADKLKEIANQVKQVNALMEKNEGSSFVSAKDINDTIKATQEATKHMNDFKEAIKEAQQEQASMGSKPNEELLNTLEKIDSVADDTTSKLEKMSNVKLGTNASINAVIKDLETMGQLSEEYYESTNRSIDATQRLKQVTASNNRVRRNLEKSQVSNRMTYDQSIQTRQALDTVDTMKRERQQVQENIKRAQSQFSINRERQATLSKDFASGNIGQKEFDTERAKIEASNKARQKEIETLNRLQKELEDTVRYFEGTASQQFNERKADAKRGSFERTWQERMPSISSHAFMGMSAVAGGLYMKGSSLSEANRPYTVSLGQQTGQSDYSSIRHNFEDMSIDNKLGYNSTDMLKFASDVTGSMGYKGQDNLNGMVKELATGGKALGIANQESYSEAMSGLMHTGGISNGTDMKELQGAFLGGLKESGMVGRNEEQLKALTSIAENVGRGQTLTKEDLGNITAEQGILASTGSKGLQGEQGANFMNQLNQGIRNGMSDPMTRISMGWGTEYQGLSGGYDLQKRLDKGISDPENITDIANMSNSMYGDSKEGKYIFNQQLKQMGVEATIEQSDALFEKAINGKLTQKEIDKFREKTEKEGSKEKDKNSEDYKESKEGRNDNNKAKTDKQAENVYDMTQGLRDMHSAMAGLPTIFYMMGAAGLAFATSIAQSIAMMKGASMMRGFGEKGGRLFGGGKNNGTGGGLPGGGNPTGGGNSPKGGSPTGGATGSKGTTSGGATKGGGIKGKAMGGLTSLGTMLTGGSDWKGFVGDNSSRSESRNKQFKDMGGRFKGAYDKVKGTDYTGTWGKYKDLGKDKFGTLKDKAKGVDYTGTWGKYKEIGKDKFGTLKGKTGGILDKIKNIGGKTPPPSGIIDDMATTGSKGGGLLSKAGTLGKFGKGLGGIGVGLSALSLIPALKSGDSEQISKGVGATGGGLAGSAIGGAIGSLFGGVGAIPGSMIGGTIGSFAGDNFGGWMNGTVKRANKNPFFGWDDGKGKGGVKDSLIGKIWGGTKKLFGFGNEAEASEKGKGGGGGGASDPSTPKNPTGSGMADAKRRKDKGESLGFDLSFNPFKPASKGATNANFVTGGGTLGDSLTGKKDGSKIPPGGGLLSGIFGGIIGSSGISMNGNDEEGDNKEKNTGGGFFGVKKDTTKKKRVEAEKLREKNNESETKNLKVYKSLLDRFEQLIQDAKSLDLEGGSEGGDSEGGSDGGKSASEIKGKGGKKIWNFFKDKGLSDEQVSAILGNLDQESGLSPTITNSSTGAYGIAQWLGVRKTNLDNFAKSQGKKSSDLDVQLDFLWKEMNSDYEKGQLKSHGWSKNGSVEQNTQAFARGFERMGEHEAMMNTRISGAKSAKKNYGGGGGGGGLDSLLDRPPVTTYAQPQNTTSVGDTSNNINVTINVEGSDDPKATAEAVRRSFESSLDDLDIFSNQYRRV